MSPTRRAGLPAFLLAIGGLILPGGALGQTSLVIYRDGRVLTQRTLTLAIPRGTSRHRIELEQFDAGSLAALDSGVVLTEVRYPWQLDEATLYRAMVGRRLVFETYRGVSGPDTLSALVVGDDPMRFELPGGVVRLSPPGTPLFPRDLVGSARPTFVTIESNRALGRLTLGYVTSGATWQAEYAVVLAAGTAAVVSGRVVVTSDELRADSAELAVLEGQVARSSEFQREAAQARARAPAAQELGFRVMSRGAVPQFGDQGIGVGGFRLYPVAGRYQIAPGSITVGPLFPTQQATAARVYTVASQGMNPGGPEVYPVEVRYRIARPRETPFGSRPLPPGVARLYSRLAASGAPVLVGEATVAQADPGRTLELSAGQAVELRARRIRFTTSTVMDSVIGPDRRASVSQSGQVGDAEIRFSNATDTLATVEFTEPIGRPVVLVSSSVPAERLETALRFTLQVPPRGETVLRYRVRLNP